MYEKASNDIQERPERRIRQRREERAARSGRNWIIGMILVMTGLLTIASNLNFVSIYNWWAFFIMIPAAAGFGSFINELRASGRLTSRGWSGLIAGLIIICNCCHIAFQS